METRTIECVAFFYHEGAKGDDFIQKISFDAASIPVSGEVSRGGGGGALGYFLGGYVPPGTPNWHPVLKNNFP